MAQSVKHPTLAQVMILQFVGLSPTLGSRLTAQSLELVWILSLPLSLSLHCSSSLSLSLSQKSINITNFFFRGIWVAQSVKCPTLAQVTMSPFRVRAPHRALC